VENVWSEIQRRFEIFIFILRILFSVFKISNAFCNFVYLLGISFSILAKILVYFSVFNMVIMFAWYVIRNWVPLANWTPSCSPLTSCSHEVFCSTVYFCLYTVLYRTSFCTCLLVVACLLLKHFKVKNAVVYLQYTYACVMFLFIWNTL